MVRKVNDLDKTAHKSKPVSKRRLQYLLHKAEVLSNQYKVERDTLIDDLSWYKAKVSRLEREKEKIRKNNKGLQLKADGFFNKWINDRNLLSEISQHIGNKPSSRKYKYFRAKLNALEIREGE